MIERKNPRTARIAFFSVVHELYFEQFCGLEKSLNNYHNETIELVESNNVEVINYGIIGSNSVAFEVADKIIGDKIDLIICNMITYATSSVFEPVLKKSVKKKILRALLPLFQIFFLNVWLKSHIRLSFLVTQHLISWIFIVTKIP